MNGFVTYGFTSRQADFTKLFACLPIEPTQMWLRGDSFMAYAGVRRRETFMWKIESFDKVHPFEIRYHIEWVLRLLGPISDGIWSALTNTQADAVLQVNLRPSIDELAGISLDRECSEKIYKVANRIDVRFVANG